MTLRHRPYSRLHADSLCLPWREYPGTSTGQNPPQQSSYTQAEAERVVEGVAEVEGVEAAQVEAEAAPAGVVVRAVVVGIGEIPCKA